MIGRGRTIAPGPVVEDVGKRLAVGFVDPANSCYGRTSASPLASGGWADHGRHWRRRRGGLGEVSPTGPSVSGRSCLAAAVVNCKTYALTSIETLIVTVALKQRHVQGKKLPDPIHLYVIHDKVGLFSG